MSDFYFGADFGQAVGKSDITAQATSPSKAVELKVTYTATAASKTALLDLLEAIENAVTTQTWPPA